MYTFWQGIKSLRSVAYFKQAMDSGGTEDLQQKWKDNPRWRDRIILSGVICASTVALFARSVYRKIKKKIDSNKTHHDSPSRRESYHVVNHDRPQDLPQTNGQPAEIIIKHQDTKPVESVENVTDVDKLFKYDSIPTENICSLKDRLLVMKIKEISERPNSIEICDDKHKFFLNGSGIFDYEHNAIHNRRTEHQVLEIMKVIKSVPENEILDVFSMFESFE